jgi:hypothetical protein
MMLSIRIRFALSIALKCMYSGRKLANMFMAAIVAILQIKGNKAQKVWQLECVIFCKAFCGKH